MSEHCVSFFAGLFRQWMRNNHTGLSAEKAAAYLNNELLAAVPAAQLMNFGINLPVHVCTARRWMQRLGAESSTYQQGFFTDNHCKPEVVEFRKQFCHEEALMHARMPLWCHLPFKLFMEDVLPCMLLCHILRCSCHVVYMCMHACMSRTYPRRC